MNEEKIQSWQEKIRSNFGDASRLYQYLFETMDNFYYRYLETTLNKNLKTRELGPHLWGAESFESDMVAALKVQSPETKTVVMELAKTIPKSQNPQVHYSLKVKVGELTADRGHLVFESQVKGLQTVSKTVNFKYQDLNQFRKEVALKLEEACEIFL